jgi:hypothetical protein
VLAGGLKTGQHRQNKKPGQSGEGAGHLQDEDAEAKLILVTANTTIGRRKGCITHKGKFGHRRSKQASAPA